MNLEIQQRSARAFTLIEVLIAVTIFAILLAAINGLYFGAMKLQVKATDAVDQGLMAEHAEMIIKRDIEGMVVPSIVLQTNTGAVSASGMQETSEGYRYIAGLTTSGTSSGMQRNVPNGIKGAIALEIYTSTGLLTDELPWGDVQKVDYSLEVSTNRMNSGRDLVRSVTRNLLATTPEISEQQRLLNNIQQMQVSFFDGTNWMDTWGPNTDTNYLAPTAIRLLVKMAADPEKKSTTTAPLQLEWLFPVPIGMMTTNINSY